MTRDRNPVQLRGAALRALARVGPLLLTAALGGAGFRIAAAQTASIPAASTTAEAPQKARQPLSELPGVPLGAARPARSLDEQPEVRDLYQAAVERMEEEDYAGAADRLDQAFELAQGDYYELFYLMALAKYRQGSAGAARGLAENAAALRPRSADVHYLLGQLYRGQGQLDRAIDEFRTATLVAADEPNNPRATAAWYQLGAGLLEAGYWSAAAEAYARLDEALWETHPEHRTADEIAPLLQDRPRGLLEARLDLLHRLGRLDDAVHAAAEARERMPDDAYLDRLYARALLEASRAAEAFDFCRERLVATKAAEGDPDLGAASSAVLSVGVAAGIAAGRVEAWADDLAADVSQKRWVKLARAVARRLAEAGQPAAAGRLWRSLAAREPDDPGVAWALAAARRDAGQSEAALISLMEFVRKHPDLTHVPYAPFEAWLKDWKSSGELTPLAARLNAPADADFATNFVLGTAAVAADQPELAEKLFDATVSARPGFALAHVAWSHLLLDQYRWADAQAHAEAALQPQPGLAAAHYVLALAHVGLSENNEAETEFRAALRAQPNEPAYAVALADLYRRMGNTLAAQRYFQEALDADPTSGVALEPLIDSYLGGNKLELARAQFRKAERHDIPEDALRRARTTVQYARVLYQEEHLAELRRQFDEFPDDLETGLKLAAGLFVRGRTDEAFGYAQRALARRPDDERALSLMARVQARRLEYDAALQVLEALARRYPHRQDVQSLLAECYLADFRLDEGRAALRRLLAGKLSDDARLAQRRRLVETYVDFSEYDEALHLLDEWIEAEPSAPMWARDRLQVLLLAGRSQDALDLTEERLRPVADQYREATDRLKRVYEQFQATPDDASLRARGAQLQRDLGELRGQLFEQRAELIQVCLDARLFKAAEVYARAWLAEEPGEPQTLQWLVQTLIADDRPDEAVTLLADLRSPDPRAEAAARGWRARAEAAAGRPDAAVEILKSLLGDRAAPLSRDQRDGIWDEYILILLNAGRYDDALAAGDDWFAEWRQTDKPARIRRLRTRCLILQQARRTEEYFKTAEQWLELDPEGTLVNNDLGYSWVDAGRNLPRATQMIRKAVADAPLRAAYLDSLGWAYYKAGEFGRARHYLARAARLREGQDPVIYDHLGDTAYRLGDADAARDHWQKSLELVEREQAERKPPASRTDLVDRVRAKLAALEDSAPPSVAPTAAEPTKPEE